MTRSLLWLAGSICALSMLALLPGVGGERPAGPKVWPGKPCSYVDYRQVLVLVLPGGRITINDLAYDEPGARAAIRKMMQSYETKSLWVAGDGALRYGQVAGFIAKLERDTPGLVVGLMTESQMGQAAFDRAAGQMAGGRRHPLIVIPPCFPWSHGRS